MSTRRAVATILPLVLIAAASVVGVSRDTARMFSTPVATRAVAAESAVSSATQQTRTPIDAPQYWVPFEADVRIYLPGYNASVGRFSRGADGSTRQSTGPSEKDVRVISIRNVSQASYFLFSEGRWERFPMDVDAANYRPRGRLQDNHGIELYPFKLAFLPGQNLSVYGQDGIEVWRVITGDGSVRLEAPSLNFFALVAQSITGRREEYVNVRHVTPSPSEYLPPPGADVAFVNETRGISRTPPKQLEQNHP